MNATDFLKEARGKLLEGPYKKDKILSDHHKKKGRREVYDPIHGKINLEDYIVDLLDTPVVQRLRYVGQLGPAYLLYPTATYSRFEHIIGVYWVSKRIIDELLSRETTPHSIKSEIDSDAVNVLIAALLHDIGHLPFSHTAERFFDEKFQVNTAVRDMFRIEDVKLHEFVANTIINSDYFKEKVEKMKGNYPLGSVSHEVIAQFVIGHSPIPERQFLADIVHGSLDADRIDYIQRDNQKIGFPQIIDVNRLLKTLTIVDIKRGKHKGKRVLAVEYKGTQASETLLYARYRLNHLVFKHHVTKVAEEMLMAALDFEFSEGEYTDILTWTDFDVFSRLRKNDKNIYAQKLLSRQLPKRHIYLEALSPAAVQRLKTLSFDEKINLRQMLAKALGIDIESIFIDVVEKDIVEKGVGSVDMGEIWRKGQTANHSPQLIKYSLIIASDNPKKQIESKEAIQQSPLVLRIFMDWKDIGAHQRRKSHEIIHKIVSDSFDCSPQDFYRSVISRKYVGYRKGTPASLTS